VSITRAETASLVTRGRDDHLTGRHLAAVDGLDARRPDRPSTTPAYYLGRPASLWLDVFGPRSQPPAPSQGGSSPFSRGGFGFPSRSRTKLPSSLLLRGRSCHPPDSVRQTPLVTLQSVTVN
jgi:hypothetical protein